MTATHAPPRQLRAVVLLASVLVAAALAGCASNSGGAPATGATSGDGAAGSAKVKFSAPPIPTRSADRVKWLVKIQNVGTAPVDALTVSISVVYSYDATAAPHKDRATVNSLDAGASQSLVLQTTYQGYGDYSGVAKITDASGATLATQEVFYEDCGPC